MIALDASVLIAYFEANDAHHRAAVQLLTTHARRTFVASPLTLAELLVGPVRTGTLTKAVRLLDDLGVQSIQFAVDAPPQLAQLRAATGLRLPDCCVVLAAESTNADLATFDDRLGAAARKRGLTVHDAAP